MRLLVTGGRDFRDPDGKLRAVLCAMQPDLSVVIHGGALGADSITSAWCRERGVEEIAERVTQQEWDMLGGFAGNARNQRMLRHRPDLVLACPGHSGTHDMMIRAEGAGVPVVRL